MGDTPPGLFARVSQKLNSRPSDEIDGLDLDNAIEELDKQQRDQAIYSLKRQIVRHTGNLNKLLEEAATYGSRTSAPLKLQNQIEEIETTIAGLQVKLEKLGTED